MSRGFHVVLLKGGNEERRLTWGFRLAGGRGTPLTVVQVDKDGKSSGEDGLLVGDQVLRINDVFCSSLAAAQQLIDSAFRTLTLAVFRVSADAAHGCPSINDMSSSPQKKHRHPLGGDEPRVEGGSPRVSDGGFRHGDEGRASTRTNPDNGVSRTGSRTLDEWRRKANQLLSRTPSTVAAVPPHQAAQHQKHQHQHSTAQQHPYQSNPHLHLQQQQVSGNAMAVQHQRQQRRNSLGGEHRERAHSFHETKGVPQHHRSNAVINNNKTAAEMVNWNASGYSRMASPLSAKAASPTKGHGQRSPSECESRAENIYENVGQQKPQQQMALVSHEKSASSLSSCCSSPSADRLLQNTGAKNLVGESRVRPAFERERRSLRKLTKDSGYETSPYSESDYANMEWLSDQNSERGLMSPSPTHTHMSSYPPYWDSMSDHEGPYQHYPSAGQQRVSRNQYPNQMEGSYAIRSGHLISSRSKSTVYPESRDSGYISVASKRSSQSRRLSTGEGWIARSHSEQTRELALGRYSSTDSLSSYSSNNSRHHPVSKVVSAKSTPSLNQQDGRIEEPPVLAPSSPLTGSMSSSRSTPNLDNDTEDAMVSRKFKKASVYEALANKSGLDFAPTIQGRHQWDQKERRDGSFNVQHQRSSSTSSCQPYHCRQSSSQSTASDCTSSSGNSQSGHSRQISGHSSYSEDEGRILSPRSEDSLSSDMTAFPYHHGRNMGHASLPSFPTTSLPGDDPNAMMENFHGNHWIRNQPNLEHLPPPSPGSPPPPVPPIRDGSSLKYMKYGSDHHEKYPSWPVGQSDGSQRSRSWTEGTNDASKDKAAYLRSKKYSQTSFTQQLKTVVENAEKVALEDPRFISALQGQYFSHLGNPPSEKPSTMERSASYEFGSFCKSEHQAYLPSYDREFSHRDYNVHSPPERDVTPEKQRQHRREEMPLRNDLGNHNQIRQKKMVNSSPQNNSNSDVWWSSSQSSDFQYSSDATLVLTASNDHQDTPMLDRLRLESTQWSGDQEGDGGASNNGGAGGRGSITSTTSSQETLKWHGSNSDLSVHSDKNARHSVETVVHSARVQPPQRHNSESVLYYGADEASAIARSVSDGKRDSPPRQGSYASGDNADIAPPLPRKTRQWSDQVQKNNYINRIQMQVRPVVTSADHGTSTTVSAPGLRAASLAREEIQPPLNPEFAKPLSVAERIQDLERQARIRGSMNNNINQSNRPYTGTLAVKTLQQRQKISNGISSPCSGSTPKAVQRQATFSEGSSLPPGPVAETRMAYLDPEKKHKVSDPELKAIQKQAVWSFFERQTGLSAHGRSNSKESVQFLSRRMAQSLPRDCMQEFKRLQQLQQNEEKKKHGIGAGPVTALPTSQMSTKSASKHHRHHENGQTSKREHKDTSQSSFTKVHHQPCEPTSARSSNRHQHRASKGSRSSTLSSNSSSSSSSTSSPATPTVPSSVSSSPTQLIRQPSVCYNTCTQTETDTAVLEQLPLQTRNDESKDGADKMHTPPVLQKAKITCQEGTPPLKPLNKDRCTVEASQSPVTSEDLKITKGTQNQREQIVIDAEEQLPNLIKTSSMRELRTFEEHSLPCNVPCEQTPTKHVNNSESSVLSSNKTQDFRQSPSHLSKGNFDAEPSPIEESYVASTSPEVECVEDVELRKIEESAKVLRNLLPSGSSGTYTPRTHRRIFLNPDGLRNSPSPSISCPSLSSRSSTPDLPLPPHPKMIEFELVICDEPLPPPPSSTEMKHSLVESQTKSPSPNSTSLGTYLSCRGEHHHSDNICQRSLINSSKMDKPLSPCTAWEQWHNIRQSNTTLVFHSGEMMSSKSKQSTGAHPLSESSLARDSEINASVVGNGSGIGPASSGRDKFVEHRLSPASRLKAAGSVESLRSVESSNSAASSISCWQETEQSLPSSSSSLSGSIPTLLNDGQKPACPSACSLPIGKAICKSPRQSIEDGNLKMTEAMTQTTPSISKLGRKKRDEELECERLSIDLINHLSGQDNTLRHILVPAPEMKTMADYMEGIFEVDVKERDVNQRRTANSSPSSPPPALEQVKRKSSDILLPADSAYFTTSESKAKFLTRYSKNMQQSHVVALSDVKNGSELSEKKSELVDSITRKLKILRMEQLAIKEEISINDELGSSVTGRVEQLAKPNEVDKFKLHVEEVEKITSLLLGLSGRLARAQNALMTLLEDANHEERKSLEAKRNKLCEQHEEAKKLKESIDRRGVQVSNFLHNYLSSEEYADFDHFIKMKAKLLMDSREIDDKIKLGEEQMLALRENLKT